MTPHSEHLEVKFTDAEKLEMGRDVARLNQEKRRLDQKLAEIKKQLAGEISAKETEIDRLMDLLSNGYEYRQVECRIALDTPKPGQASVIRLDTEEVVRVRRMNEDELQIELPLEDSPEPEPVVEAEIVVTSAEPERTYDYNKPGARASVRVWQDSAGVCHYHAGVIITADDEQKVYDSGIENAFTSMDAAAKDGVLAVWQWAHALYSDSTKIALRGLIFGVVDWVRVTLPTISAAE